MGCGCGYVDPEKLKKMAYVLCALSLALSSLTVCRCSADRASKPEMPLEVRNKKKLLAIEATRLDGNRLFKEKEYEQAFKIYERVSEFAACKRRNALD